MNTIEKLPIDELPDPTLPPDSDATESEEFIQPKIRGFDNGTRPIFREPSIYLSVAIVFVATSVCLSKTPIMFWSVLAAMIAVAVALHVIAERFLFRGKEEHRMFAAPFEGMFVITFGAILPGLALLAYGAYSLSTVRNPNILEELGKLALLLVVPFFNFLCWSAVRRGYLIRPRVTGLMTGFALGLSASWTLIFLKTVFLGHSDSACKFGWMLLLCTSPFLLFAAVCLSLDLWNKTDSNIRRITTTFSILGMFLSLVFVFTPMCRGMFVQSLIVDAKQAPEANRSKAVSVLREVATDQDLRPSKYPVSGFSLAELLISNRGLSKDSDADKTLYFETTGEAISSNIGIKNSESDSASADDLKNAKLESQLSNPAVGDKIYGLSLAKSQLSGNIDAASYTSSIDWTMTFKNSSPSPEEARCEIAIPKQSVVSRVTLSSGSEPREAAFAPTATVLDKYNADIRSQRDPLLVTMPTPDHILVRCFPIAPNGGEMKIRIGFKVPLDSVNGKICSMELPKLLSSNFAAARRQRVNIFSHDLVVQNIPGITSVRTVDGYSLSGVIKNQPGITNVNSLTVLRTSPLADLVYTDLYAKEPQYIVQKLREVMIPSPKRLSVVIDLSASLKGELGGIKKALSAIPTSLNTIVYFAEPDGLKEQPKELTSQTIDQALKLLSPDLFVGGINNWTTLRDAIENTAEISNGAVLWIHGAQPVAATDPVVLDLVHRVCVYDLQIAAGPNLILPALQTSDVSGIVASEILDHKSTVSDVQALVNSWNKGTKGLAIQRIATSTRPQGALITDKSASAQVSCLWAKDELSRLLASGQAHKALLLAGNYRMISPISGAVVLESGKAYVASKLRVPEYAEAPMHSYSSGGGLVGAPVDPRYGQSNEVGQMADFGYDTARDISRVLTFLSLIVSLIIATVFLRGRKTRTGGTMLKVAAMLLAVPTTVHVLGTFMINNFGGLGGGL